MHRLPLPWRRLLRVNRSGRLTARRTPSRGNTHPVHAATGSAGVGTDDVERAWAAGFMDAEGCFGLARSMERKKGPRWYKIRVSASQHGQVGVPADVLRRLHAAFEGQGRIERHGEPDDYRWLAEGEAAVEYVLRRTDRWLGQVKVIQATTTLERFRAQVRLRGTASHCVRGHPYSGVALRGGRLRRICRECNLIYRLRERAARDARLRKRTNAAHRYTP